MNQVSTLTPEQIVERYFAYIRDLRRGDEAAADRLMELWDDDGVFEFAGAPPVTGTFKGHNAIHVLYKNRAKAAGMRLTLEGGVASLTEPAAADTPAPSPAVVTRPWRSFAVRYRPHRARRRPAAARRNPIMPIRRDRVS